MVDTLPILHLGLESVNPAIVDKSLGCLPTILTVLDYSSIKNEVFPTVASVFSRTSSLGIKVRGLEAFVVLCGGSRDKQPDENDDFTGLANNESQSKAHTNAVLDKYTVQEKVVPLLKAMKTKEPTVMMAALAVFKQVGKIADAEFLALETLPILWSFSLGPLLNLQQFQQYMDLIKKLSARIESEQVKKLRDLSSEAHQNGEISRSNDLMNVAAGNGLSMNQGADVGENDFERLVLGSKARSGTDMLGDAPAQPAPSNAAMAEPHVFSWSSPQPTLTTAKQQPHAIAPNPGLQAFSTLSPTSATGAQSNMQRTMANGLNSYAPMQPATSSPWASRPAPPAISTPPGVFSGGFPAPPSGANAFPQFSIAPPPAAGHQLQFSPAAPPVLPGLNSGPARPAIPTQKKNGLDAYESLL